MIFILVILVTMNIDVMYLFWFNDWPNYSEYFRQDIIVKCIALHTKLILCFKAKPILMMIRVECLKRFLYEWWFCIRNKLEKVYWLLWMKREFFSVTLTRKRRSYILDEKFFFAILQILDIVIEGWYRVHMNEQGIFFRVFPRDNHCWLDDMDRIGLMGLIKKESLTIILYTVPKYNLEVYDTWRRLIINHTNY